MKKRKRIFALLCCVLLLLTVSVHAEGQETVRIAFLDSGVSCKHLDGTRIEDGENLVFPDRDTDDRIGHGTATAGIVLGSDELGLTGICPQATVVPLVCYDSYPSGVNARGDGKTIAQAIRLSVDRYDCRIINISMGMTQDEPALREAVEYALARGAIIVSAVGNSNQTAPESVYYPAAYDGVIGVGSADGEWTASFSQRHGVDVLAQGVNLQTVTNRNTAKAQTSSGTSYSCAIVSGLCAAIWTEEPELSADEVRERLRASAKDIEAPGFDADSGWGLVSALSEPSAPASAFAFRDTIGHWAEDSIAFCVSNGIFNGVGGEYFDPDGTMTRAMIASTLYRMAGSPDIGINVDGFSDMTVGQWYTDAVLWGRNTGIMTGYGDGRFGTNDTVTREQMCTLLMRYLRWAGYEFPAKTDAERFLDDAQIASWASEGVSFCRMHGFVNGLPDGRFAPQNSATRAESSAVLQRVILARDSAA